MIQRIIDETCARWGVTEEDLRSPRRTTRFAWARQEAFTRLRDETPLSFPDIAAIFDRDHSTVVKGVSAFRNRIKKGQIS
jgi:chromosomal replication initiator protein